MMTASMMRDRYEYKIYKNNDKKINDSEACICGYQLRKDSDYINNQNQLVSVMVCDSCGAIEHWVEDTVGLLEAK